MAWINGFQDWLSETQSLQNAQAVVNFLYVPGKDWSKGSICALIGNMRHESSVNPNMYEYGYTEAEDRGFGLVQWTPRSKFWDWGEAQGYTETELRSGDSQLARIDYEVANNIQYIPNGHAVRYGNATKYDFSFADFRANVPGLPVRELTEAFMWNYEGPSYTAGVNSLTERQDFAIRAFYELDWTSGGGEPVPDEPGDEPGGVDVAGFVGELNQLIEGMLTADIIKNGSSQYAQNGHLQLMTQLNNSYKLKPSAAFFNAINQKFQEWNGGYVPPPDGTDPPPEPTATRMFPVRIQNGINFWKRSNWGVGTLQRNMTYGERSTGEQHYGYDIGGGGNSHTIYAVTAGEVVQANFGTGIGYRVIIQNDDDIYFLQYGHLDSFLVSIGDKVTPGDPIGIMGASGGNYAIHLDVKISTSVNGFYSYDTSIDPEYYLGVTGDNQTTLAQP